MMVKSIRPCANANLEYTLDFKKISFGEFYPSAEVNVIIIFEKNMLIFDIYIICLRAF